MRKLTLVLLTMLVSLLGAASPGLGGGASDPVAAVVVPAPTADLDGNGIADLPHRELDLFSGLRRELPAIGLLAGSPAERVLRFVHARVAVPGAHGIVDPAPLVDGGLQ